MILKRKNINLKILRLKNLIGKFKKQKKNLPMKFKFKNKTIKSKNILGLKKK